MPDEIANPAKSPLSTNTKTLTIDKLSVAGDHIKIHDEETMQQLRKAMDNSKNSAGGAANFSSPTISVTW